MKHVLAVVLFLLAILPAHAQTFDTNSPDTNSIAAMFSVYIPQVMRRPMVAPGIVCDENGVCDAPIADAQPIKCEGMWCEVEQ